MVEVAPPPTSDASQSIDATRRWPGLIVGRPWLARLLEAVALALVAALALNLRMTNLDAYTGSFDEGIRAQQLLLMADGFRPFRDIFASQGPLLLDVLYPFYLLFGQSLTAARGGVVACSLAALLGAWWTVRQAAGSIGGLAAVLILGISPTFLEGSRLALAEVPIIAPALVALGAILAYRRTGRRALLVCTALACALSILMKPMALPLGAAICMLLLMPPGAAMWPAFRWPWRRALLDSAIFSAVFAAICALTILLLGPAGVWDNLGAYRSGAGSTAGANAAVNLRLTINIMRAEGVGLYALAAAGALLGLWRRPALTAALLIWAAAVLGMFVVYGDLADKHIVLLVPPVALLAALGVGLGATALPDVVRTARTGRRPLLAVAPAVLGLLGVLAYLAAVPAILRADQYLLREAPRVAAERRERATDQEITAIIQANTPPDGWVLADNPLAAYEARRRVIPYLVDTSGTRIDAGSLTTPLAVEYVQRYQPSVIVTWPRRLGKLDPFVEQLPALGYHLEKSYPIGWKVYVLVGGRAYPGVAPAGSQPTLPSG